MIRMPTSRVRMHRARPLCASLAMTTGAWVKPQRVRSSTEHQPSTVARLPPVAGGWPAIVRGQPAAPVSPGSSAARGMVPSVAIPEARSGKASESSLPGLVGPGPAPRVPRHWCGTGAQPAPEAAAACAQCCPELMVQDVPTATGPVRNQDGTHRHPATPGIFLVTITTGVLPACRFRVAANESGRRQHHQ